MLPRERLRLRNRNWRRNLEKFVDSVKRFYGKVLIILFGSRARGEYSAYSDTDILIVLENYNEEDLRRLLSLAYKFDLISPEIHLFDKQYVLNNFEENTVLLDAVYEGTVLFDSLGIVEELKRRLAEYLNKGFRRNKNGWKLLKN